MQRPDVSEYASFYQGYVELVPAGPIQPFLERQMSRTAEWLLALDEPKAMHRYAPGKWSVKEVVGHIADGERVLAYRTLRFARGDATELPSYDENLFVANAGFDRQPMWAIAEDLRRVRAATLTLLDSLQPGMGTRRGVANGKMVTVQALVWIIAGHELHHLKILRERYGLA